MFSQDDIEIFRARGIVKVERLIPEARIAPARDVVYDGLERVGLWKEGTWVDPADDARMRKDLKALRRRTKSKTFERLVTDEVLERALQLNGDRPVVMAVPKAQLLFTAPDSSGVQWRLPHNVWHLDYARFGDLGPPGVQMFTFLDAVEPQGGGTLLIAGSHRLLNDQGVLGSKEVRRRLQRYTYFRELTDKTIEDRNRLFGRTECVEGVPLEIVELTGNPGDVYFTDLRLLHSLGPNVRRRPRLMVTQRLPYEAVHEKMRDVYGELQKRRQAGKKRRAGGEGAGVAGNV